MTKTPDELPRPLADLANAYKPPQPLRPGIVRVNSNEGDAAPESLLGTLLEDGVELAAAS